MPHPAGRRVAKTGVGVLVLAVPALLVVVLGYVVGYGVAGWLGAAPRVGEAVGWTTGLVLLVAVVTAGIRWRRRRRAARGARPPMG